MSSKLNEIIDTLQLLDDVQEKYQYLIDLGKELPPIAEKYKNSSNIVHGCTSRLWLKTISENNILSIFAQSDALIVNGLCTILISIYDKKTANEILEINFQDIIQQFNFQQILSSNRNNGFMAMQKKLIALATDYQ